MTPLHRRTSPAWRARLLAWGIASALTGLVAAQPTEPPKDTRRPGSDYMGPALQTLQRDDSQHPGMLWVQDGEALWRRPGPNGKRCSDCHGDAAVKPVGAASAVVPVATANANANATRIAPSAATIAAPIGASLASSAARYPVFDTRTKRPISLAGRIDRCRQDNQQAPPQGPDGDEVLALSAWLAQQARGLPMSPPADSRLQPWEDRGAALWRQRLGQLNLACTHCHDQRAGERLGGAPIPQGHATGYPTYRLEWQGLGSLQRRMRGCLVGVRAEPFSPDADEWLALEVFLARRAAGMPMQGVAVRP